MNQPNTDSQFVVLIDDDNGPMEFYEDAFRDENWRVERFRSVIKALKFIQSTDIQPRVWIIDLMMPIEDADFQVDGQPLRVLASLGLASGRVLYRQIRKRFPTGRVVLLTNMSTPQILDELEAEMDKKTAAIFSKMATMPSELVAYIHSNT